MAAGAWIVTLALLRLATPGLAFTAVALIPLPLIPPPRELIAAPFPLLRGCSAERPSQSQ